MQVEIADALSQSVTIIFLFVVCHYTSKHGFRRATLFQRIVAGYFIMTLSTICQLIGYYNGLLVTLFSLGTFKSLLLKIALFYSFGQILIKIQNKPAFRYYPTILISI